MFRFMIMMIVVLVTSCTRAPDAVGVETVVPVDTVEGLKSHEIFIATTRAQSDDEAEFFSGDRQLGLSFASVDVTVPPIHEPGQIERTKADVPDPRRHFTIQDPNAFATRQGFMRDLEEALRKRPPDRRNVLLFVHGYNTTMTDAILQVTQFVEDTEYDGIPILFSWASGGAIRKYVYDLNSVLVARDGLASMGQVLQSSAIEHFDLLAHSMGSFLTMEVVRQASLLGRVDSLGKARNVVLASPDIDIDLFLTQIKGIPPEKRTFVVMVSDDDRARAASSIVDGSIVKVGRAPAEELAKLGVIAIDLSKIDDQSSLSHSKFSTSPEIVQLIGDGLATKSTFGNSSETTGEFLRNSVDGLVDVILPN
ncbi:MAG: alpha/beta hydrolase [Pseudomonadota bacterium]